MRIAFRQVSAGKKVSSSDFGTAATRFKFFQNKSAANGFSIEAYSLSANKGGHFQARVLHQRTSRRKTQLERPAAKKQVSISGL
jgi:hypothetical protein